MTRHRAMTTACVVLVLAAGSDVGQAANAGPHIKGSREQTMAIQRAIQLLSEPLQHSVVVIDPELAVDADAVRRVDAFVVREPGGRLRPTIYLNSESRVLAAAVEGSASSVAALAALLVHEQCHLKGGSEEDARRSEAAFLAELNPRGTR
jgi:hypothetical protein